MPHALVVGIDHYADDNVPILECAVNDAEAVSIQLTAAGFHVTTLTGEDATLQAIFSELEVGINQKMSGADDIVVLYWAGHGFTHTGIHDDSDSGWTTFLMPFDAVADEPLRTALAVPQVWALLDRLTTRRVAVLLDTCFSGAFAADGSRGFAIGGRGAPALSDDLLKMEGLGRIVVSACGPREVAHEDRKNGHGYFTQTLLEVLSKGSDDSGAGIPVTSLTSQVREGVSRATRYKQTPSVVHSGQGIDWSFPLPPAAPYRSPMPSWAFVGTSGGVGKTTLAMMTAELLAESGNNVVYLDADIAHIGGTSEWCQRAKIDIGKVRTFSDHVAKYSRAKIRQPPELSDKLIDVTPEYLKRNECGTILLLPGARVNDKLFAFELIAELKDRRSNSVCREIIDGVLERGRRAGATCVVIDCGAQFDPLAVNCLYAAHHPFIVCAARAGAKEAKDTILSNCSATIPEFDALRVTTVVNRVPSMDSLIQHWGRPGWGRPGMHFHWLPFDRELFKDWEEGRPNFELGYDELSSELHDILVSSDQNACMGAHRELLPDEWDRFSKWALWIVDRPGWVDEESKLVRKTASRNLMISVALVLFLAGIVSMIVTRDFDRIGVAFSAMAVIVGVILAPLGIAIRGSRRRLHVLADVAKYSVTRAELQRWFSVPLDDGKWWQVWKPSRRAAIEWLHDRVVAARKSTFERPPLHDESSS